MSVVNRKGLKVILPRVGMDEFWDDVREKYAGADPAKWKHLAMLSLRVNAHWSLDMIGNAFGHERGQVSRALATTCRELRADFAWFRELELLGEDGDVEGPRSASERAAR